MLCLTGYLNVMYKMRDYGGVGKTMLWYYSGMIWCGIVWLGTDGMTNVRHGQGKVIVWYGSMLAWYGTVRYGKARCCMVL